MDALDVKFKEFILANAQVWIGNPKEASLITRNIDDYYVSPIKPAGDYPAMFAPKINIDGDKNITTTFFDEAGNLLQNPFEQVQPNSLARVRYEVQGLTQHSTTKKFYVNIRAVEAKIYPKPQGPYDDMDVAPRICSIVD
jgi:hypothetical protein